MWFRWTEAIQITATTTTTAMMMMMIASIKLWVGVCVSTKQAPERITDHPVHIERLGESERDMY